MSESKHDADFCEDQFDGTARLFPLPGLVMFPHVIQALHVFEPRYRQLLEDAMQNDKLIGMALLQKGWENEYEGAPPIEPTICLGKVVSCTELPNGCSNILLLGIHRAKVVEESESDRLYRTASVEIIHDIVERDSTDKASDHPCSDEDIQQNLLEAFQRLMPKEALATFQLTQQLGRQCSLGLLTDLIAYSLQLEPIKKQAYLSEPRVWCRANCLLSHLSEQESERKNARSKGGSCNLGFPPDFSSN